MENQKQFFAIYRDKDKNFIHEIIFAKNKKLVIENLRSSGFTVKGVFSQKNIDNVLGDKFTDVNVSDETLAYLRDHISFWDDNK